MTKAKDNNQNNKLLLYGVFLVILFLLPLLLVVVTSTNNTLPITSSLPLINKSVPTGPTATLSSENLNWVAGGVHKIEVNLDDNGVTNPVFYLLRIEYDPADLSLESIDASDYWTDQNVISKYVDENNGTITLVVGKAFDDSAVRLSSKKAATLTFSVNDTPTNNLTLVGVNPQSYITPAGTAKSVSLTSEPLVVTLE